MLACEKRLFRHGFAGPLAPGHANCTEWLGAQPSSAGYTERSFLKQLAASDPLAAEVTTPTGFIMTFQCQACPLQSFASRLRQTSDACFDAHGESRQCSPGGWRECRDPISGRRILAWRFTEQTDTNGACIVLRLSVWIFFPRILEPCEHESYKLELG